MSRVRVPSPALKHRRDAWPIRASFFRFRLARVAPETTPPRREAEVARRVRAKRTHEGARTSPLVRDRAPRRSSSPSEARPCGSRSTPISTDGSTAAADGQDKRRRHPIVARPSMGPCDLSGQCQLQSSSSQFLVAGERLIAGITSSRQKNTAPTCRSGRRERKVCCPRQSRSLHSGDLPSTTPQRLCARPLFDGRGSARAGPSSRAFGPRPACGPGTPVRVPFDRAQPGHAMTACHRPTLGHDPCSSLSSSTGLKDDSRPLREALGTPPEPLAT